MRNLLEETIEVLQRNGKTPKDVLWVGSKSGIGTWDKFEAIADFEYDDGYGGNEIHSSAKIVGPDWWLERGEYDGSEWWEFKRRPEQPDKATKLSLEDLMER